MRTQYPRRVLPADAHARELRRFTKRSPIRPRCGTVTFTDCASGSTLKLIGESDANGVHQPLYQCPACHAIRTEHQAYRAWQ